MGCRSRGRHLPGWLRAGLSAAALLAPSVPVAAQDGVWALAERLTAIGPRVPGSVESRTARHLLLDAMAAGGLQELAAWQTPGDPPVVNLTAVVPGSGGLEVLLTAHYDTVADSPGALDDAAGCAVAIRAAERLVDSGLGVAVRVVLFDAEEGGLHGSRAYAESPAGRPEVAAVLNLDSLGSRTARRAVVHVAPPAGDAALAPPAWLVDAALTAAHRSRFPLEAGESTLAVPGQLVERYGRLAYASDASPFLAAGLPAILLSDATLTDLGPGVHTPADTARQLDAERLEEWRDFVVALVEEIDARGLQLSTRRQEREYLVVAGSLWTRRSLWLAGGLMGAILVWRVLRRRPNPAPARRGAGLPGLPGFLAFTAVAWVVSPLAAALLLTPAMLIGIVTPRPMGRGIPGLIGGVLPALALVGLWGWALLAGHLLGHGPQTWRLAPALAAIVFYVDWRWRVSAPATARGAYRETP